MLTRLAIWYKRLEKGTFNLPKGGGRGLEVDVTELSMMLNGIDSSVLVRQERYAAKGIKADGYVIMADLMKNAGPDRRSNRKATC